MLETPLRLNWTELAPNCQFSLVQFTVVATIWTDLQFSTRSTTRSQSETDVTACSECHRAGALRVANSSCQWDSSAPVAWSPIVRRPSGSLMPSTPSLSTTSSMLTPASDRSRPAFDVSRPCRLNTSASFQVGFDVAFLVVVRFFFSFFPPHVISTLTNGSITPEC